MGYLPFRYNYHFSVLVFSASLMISCIAHSNSAAEARHQQLLQEMSQVEKEYQEKYNQIVTQSNQYTKDVDTQLTAISHWDSEQSYTNEQKCSQLLQQHVQNGGTQCANLREQLSKEYEQKTNQLTQERQQQIGRFQQQEEELAHQKRLKDTQILDEMSHLNY